MRRKRGGRKRLGFPEVFTGVLFLVLIGVALLTLRANLAPRFYAVQGTVLHAALIDLPYSATREPDQVEMVYTYRVDGKPYTGHFQGFWPQAGGLNALPRAEWPRLTVRGCPLTVMVDPANPGYSLLHHRDPLSPQAMNMLAFAMLAAMLYYLLRIYPRWKRGA
jgi:hypothetical protein